MYPVTKVSKTKINYNRVALLFFSAQVLVLVTFAIFMAVSLYGCFNLETGLELKDLAPTGSYLNDFDKMQSQYFGEYDFPVDIFFPDYVEWWNPAAHEALRRLQNKMEGVYKKMLIVPVKFHQAGLCSYEYNSQRQGPGNLLRILFFTCWRTKTLSRTCNPENARYNHDILC